MSTPPSFLDVAGPRVFTMPSGANFLQGLAQGVCATLDETSPYDLSDAMILTPTRRAVRALGDAFIQAHDSADAMLLPRIRALGDVDADEPPFEPGAIALHAPRAMSEEQRLFDLTALVQARLRSSGQNDAMCAAMAEAGALARLIDDAHTEGVKSFDMAREKFAARLLGQPEHVQRATRFLDIVMRYWPEHLHRHQAADPAAYRSAVLRALAQSWQHNPPAHMVLVAGSTGSVPATADLLNVIARLPQGAVILPGLDESLSDEDWEAVTQSPGHPQYGLARLLRRMGIARSEVKRWPGTDEPRPQRYRRRLVNEALLPAQATAGWGERLKRLAETERLEPLEMVREGLHGLSLIEAANEEEEALVLALAIRHTLDDPRKTAILVTPDRALAERVRAALWRWNIHIDDSAGIPLDTTPLGVFLSLIAQRVTDPAEPLALASLLGSPLTLLGLKKTTAHRVAQTLEQKYLRGVQRYASLDDLRQVMQRDTELDAKDRLALVQYVDGLDAAFAGFDNSGKASIADWARRHAQAAQSLAQSDRKSGEERLWCGRAGNAAAALLRSLMSDAGALEPVSAKDYWHVFKLLAHQRPIRPKGASQVRARILGPLEARMISADFVALGGLNEGNWPSYPAQDPFLPRSLRLALGLADPERRLGLAAHDFAEHASKSTVLLTRARRTGSEPAIASRWLWRLKTLIRCGINTADEADAILAPDTDYLALARRLDPVPPDEVTPVLAPSPKPPVKTRPRSLYVTRIKTLIRNPYGIYARYILNLEPLDPLGAIPGPAERGSAVHHALERFFRSDKAPDDPDAVRVLGTFMVGALREQGFAEHQIPAEMARFKRAGAWVLDWENQRRQHGWSIAMLEGQGALTLPKKGGDFTIKAYADRIDQSVGGYAVLDYKTGNFPSAAEVYAGFDPQLPLEAAILERQGFSKTGKTIRGDVCNLGYIKVSGGKDAGEFRALEDTSKRSIGEAVSAPEFQQKALEQLHRLIDWFDNPAHPYRCQPRAKYTDSYSHYDLLARRPEWSATLEDDGSEP